MQRVIYTLIEQGKVPTQANIASAFGVRRQQMWKFFRRHPGFLPWLDEQMTAENAHLLSPLARRHYQIGMQGSVASAEFVAKLVTGHFTRELVPPGAAINNGFVINNLVPRPPDLQGSAPGDAPLRLPPPDSIPVLDLIPLTAKPSRSAS